MRLLIANDLDDSLLHKVDVRAWAHRILWFAQNGDAIIMMDHPDAEFVDQVTSLTGVDKASLRFFVLPEGGRFNRRMFDHHLLLDSRFLNQIRSELWSVEEVHALWGSPLVRIFLEEVGLESKWPAGALFLQNGAECLNNMGNFRVFASGAGVPIADGTVCRTIEDAETLTGYLLKSYPALMIKKAHGGAGAGNLLLTGDGSISGSSSGNGRRVELKASADEDIHQFWEEHWDWASSHGRYPVVLEQYIPDARSIYVEFTLDDTEATVNELGELHFEDSRQAREVVPARAISPDVRTRLVGTAQKLASYYQRLGHRGFLSTDAIVRENGMFTFTEVNAQFTGSSHLYSVLSNQLVHAWERDLTVTQFTSPDDWQLTSIGELTSALESAGLDFSPDSRACLIPVTPCIGDRGLLIVAAVHEHRDSLQEFIARVSSALRGQGHAVSHA